MVALAALGLAVASTGLSISQGRKSSKAQKRANEAQRKINRLKNRQAKRAFLRNFRQSQAVALVQGIASGVGLESSIVQGTLASQGSQARTGLREFQTFNRLGAEFTSAQNAASSAAFKSQVFGQVASFASSFISFGGEKTTTVDGKS